MAVGGLSAKKPCQVIFAPHFVVDTGTEAGMLHNNNNNNNNILQLGC